MTPTPTIRSDLLVAALVLAGWGCGKKEDHAALPPVLSVTDFKNQPGKAVPWGGGSVPRGRGGEKEGYLVVFDGPEAWLLGRAGALPPAALSFSKLLVDIRSASAPFPAYLILGGPSKESSARYDQVWVPLGPSTLEFDLGWARSKGVHEGDPVSFQLGSATEGCRSEVVFDGVRLSMAGAPPPPAGPPPAARPAGSLLPGAGFEDGFAGWIPTVQGPSRANFAIARGSDAHGGSASAAVFHCSEGPAGLESIGVDVPPGGYRLCGAVRGAGAEEVRVEREEIRPARGGDIAVVWSPVGTLKVADAWTEGTFDFAVPPEDPARPAPVRLRLRFVADRGHFLLDDLLLAPRAADGGGPPAPPAPAPPPLAPAMTFLGLGPAFLEAGSRPRGLAVDLSPAFLGGAPPEALARFMEGRRGDRDVRVWVVGASSASTSWPETGAGAGATPRDARAAYRVAAGADRRPLAVLVRLDRGGELEDFADCAGAIGGGVPLATLRRAGGLEWFGESLEFVRRAAEAQRADGGKRAAIAWIDVRAGVGQKAATPGELRAMVYAALARGLDGAVFAPAAGEEDAGKLAAEIDRIDKEVAAAAGALGAASGPPVRVPATDRHVLAAARRTGAGWVLVIVNLSSSPVENVVLEPPAGLDGAPRSITLDGLDGRIVTVPAKG